MFGRQPIVKTQTVGFLLTPQFSMIAFTAAIEPLRLVNRIERRDVFRWQLYSINGAQVKASSDVEFSVNAKLTERCELDTLFVCSGIRTYDHLNKETSNVLRALARRGVPLGSICTGTINLAEAGVLNGFKCTIHWESIESLAERYPKLDITSSLFEVDRNRYTCSGGLAATDMMLHSIKLDYGRKLAMRVADQLLYVAGREPGELQRMEIAKRIGVTHPKLLAAIGHMEFNLEAPLSITSLGKEIGLSPRQLERLFSSELSITPSRYYVNLRLDRARNFLRQTPLSIQEIAVATGFGSMSYFSKCYKIRFGHAPKQERQIA
ncbi:MAG: GlxA family transcriptional regulator [Hellea sp.]|nr:GlxA family transcriptional regulator [Hellea sp.]